LIREIFSTAICGVSFSHEYLSGKPGRVSL